MKSGPPEAAAAPGVHPLTPERWADLERLFGPRGACAGCWCMGWRLPAVTWHARRGAGTRRAFREMFRCGPPRDCWPARRVSRAGFGEAVQRSSTRLIMRCELAIA